MSRRKKGGTDYTHQTVRVAMQECGRVTLSRPHWVARGWNGIPYNRLILFLRSTFPILLTKTCAVTDSRNADTRTGTRGYYSSGISEPRVTVPTSEGITALGSSWPRAPAQQELVPIDPSPAFTRNIDGALGAEAGGDQQFDRVPPVARHRFEYRGHPTHKIPGTSPPRRTFGGTSHAPSTTLGMSSSPMTSQRTLHIGRLQMRADAREECESGYVEAVERTLDRASHVAL
ncbi:hypothetical protein BDK51DRAFT_42657 [Blyttiomyces helicus]|uniref:Uncharacterized protein n=1 Tax=Blyttiomyces helicus TaxID=388810 RepID=A0A4P9W5G7_9FUNG|nr:hypothetical protein BDK51DRAFT_42657 [Blyttiomyces helicus]|eukprot:RKO86563.1 hypothetical protein BDK51DRAFT_42657 [Blyttiomyces helicus]